MISIFIGIKRAQLLELVFCSWAHKQSFDICHIEIYSFVDSSD